MIKPGRGELHLRSLFSRFAPLTTMQDLSLRVYVSTMGFQWVWTGHFLHECSSYLITRQGARRKSLNPFSPLDPPLATPPGLAMMPCLAALDRFLQPNEASPDDVPMWQPSRSSPWWCGKGRDVQRLTAVAPCMCQRAAREDATLLNHRITMFSYCWACLSILCSCKLAIRFASQSLETLPGPPMMPLSPTTWPRLAPWCLPPSSATPTVAAPR